MNLRTLRIKANLTQEQLGAAIGKNGRVISYYETGNHTPKITTLQALATALNVSIDELIQNSKEVTYSGTQNRP
jgi:transcriptional regulator with XRE-family HTH domain